MPSVSRTVRVSKAMDEFIAEHARAAAGEGGRPNYSRSLHVLLQLAQANGHALRHDLYSPLGALSLALALIEASTRQPDAIEGVEKGKRAVRDINLRLARPGLA